MKKEPIQPGCLWKIIVIDGPCAGIYPTTVDAVDEGTVTVAMPIVKGAFVKIPPGTPVQVEQLGAVGYSFESVVLRETYSGVPLLVLKKPTAMKRVQRRGFVRLPTFSKCRFCVLEQEPPGGGKAEPLTGRELSRESEKMCEARVCDVSGGGLGLFVRRPIDVGSRMRVFVPGFGIDAIAEVVWVVPCSEEEKEKGFRVGVRFVGMSESERTRIVGLIFKEQIRLRKMGLL